jgi:hypothetical protein
MALWGMHSKITDPRVVRITVAEEWEKLWKEHTGTAKPTASASDDAGNLRFDFQSVMVVAVFRGELSEEGFFPGFPFQVQSVYEDGERVIVHELKTGIQCGGAFTPDLNIPIVGDAPRNAAANSRKDQHKTYKAQPWGLIVLPRSDKAVVLQHDVSGLIDGPLEWETWKTLPALEPRPHRSLKRDELDDSELTGKKIDPLMTLKGRYSNIASARIQRVTSDQEWQALRKLHKQGQGSANTFGDDLDIVQPEFDKQMAVAVFEGADQGGAGYRAYLINEDHERIVIRLALQGHQTIVGVNDATQAWGIFVVPRSEKEIVVERDVRDTMDAPPKWQVWGVLDGTTRPTHLTPERLDGGIGP